MLSAKEAMQQAIERAQLGDISAGTLWLGIARELRQGSKDRSAPETGEVNVCRWCKNTIYLTDDSDWAHLGGDTRCERDARTPGRIEQDANGEAVLVTHDRAEDAQALPMFLPSGAPYLPGGPVYSEQLAAEKMANATYADRAETEVVQRIPHEPTPSYDAAGETLGDTALMVPAGVASPQADSQGTNSECLSCGLPVVWIRGRGWTHDVAGHPHSCERAAGA